MDKCEILREAMHSANTLAIQNDWSLDQMKKGIKELNEVLLNIYRENEDNDKESNS